MKPRFMIFVVVVASACNRTQPSAPTGVPPVQLVTRHFSGFVLTENGGPVPSVESSAGTCRLVGNFATRQASSVSCAATDGQGRKYELQFVSDGAPMTLRKLRQAPLPNEVRRANQIAQLECRLRAEAAKILPRDRTAYIIKCLADDGQKSPDAERQ